MIRFLRLESTEIALMTPLPPALDEEFSARSRVKQPVASLALEVSLEVDYAAAK